MTAIALSHFSKERGDIKIDIYEAASKFTETGAGVVFYMRPFKILQKFGLEADLLKLLGQEKISFLPSEYRYLFTIHICMNSCLSSVIRIEEGGSGPGLFILRYKSS